MSIIFVSHPYSADPQANAERVVVIARRLVLQGHLPLAPQLYLPRLVEESTERDLALNLCMALVALSDEVRVYGEPSAGMKLEVAEARRLGILAVDGTTGERLPPKGEPPR